MYGYIRGIVTSIESSYIILENNNIGYIIYVPIPYSYNLDEEYKVYIYNNVKEDEYSLYGFKTKSELDIYLKLLSVKGLGPKMGLSFLASLSPEEIIFSINNGDINNLKKIPKVGDKIARQLILDLKGKIIEDNNESNKELIEALQSLGYKKSDINKVIEQVDKNLSLEDSIKFCLKLLLK